MPAFVAPSAKSKPFAYPSFEECPSRFRLLVVGRPGTGKSSLINTIFDVSPWEFQHYETEKTHRANIDRGITLSRNKHLIIHCEGYEPGNEAKFRILERFIAERSQKEDVAERLHAIWLCATIPYAGKSRMFEEGDEKIFRLNRNKVPIIVVFTKLDLLVAALDRPGEKRERGQQSAERYFREKYGEIYQRSTRNVGRHTPYSLVGTKLPESLQRLIDITMKSICAEAPSPETPRPLGGLARIRDRLFRRTTEDNLPTNIDENLVQAALATAQRVNAAAKITTSIRVGIKKYWEWNATALPTDSPDVRVMFHKCVHSVHKDMIMIWNMGDLDEHLASNVFFHQMMMIVEDLSCQNPNGANTTKNQLTIASAECGPAHVWTEGAGKKLAEHIRSFMGYVADIILILQAIFQMPLPDRREDHISEIIHVFHHSKTKKDIHDAIRAFVGTKHPSTEDSVMNKIELLITNDVMKDIIRFGRDGPFLPPLLAVLRFELMANGTIVNETILGLTSKLLTLPDYRSSVSVMDAFDAELLLDFIIYLLRNNTLLNTSIPDANRKARRLMFELMSKKGMLPRSLLISGIREVVNVGIDLTLVGGPGLISIGEYGGQKVTTKMLRDSTSKNIRQGVRTWQSPSHPFILPLLGIFEEQSPPIFMSTLMENRTLIEWRTISKPSITDIQTRILQVAKGVQYLHSQGIVHGNLSAGNVLLDSSSCCQIAGFGFSQQFNANPGASPPPSSAIRVNCSPPELLRMIDKTPVDVYAFGCLYYQVFFNTMPYEGEEESQIEILVASGVHPGRLNRPPMDDNVWDLIQHCWAYIPSKRPTMEQILRTHMILAPIPSLLATLNELVALGDSMVNANTLHLMCKVLDQSESHQVGPELGIDSDIELFLDFIIVLLRNGNLANTGNPGANQNARRLMFKLVSTRNVIPTSLFITNVTIRTDSDGIGMGGFGHVVKGKHQGKPVAIKELYRARYKQDSVRQDFCREALIWRSLSHRFILPFLGIYEDASRVFLVSPFMTNGTLTEWRKEQPSVVEIHRLLLEVAQGLEYIHSEGIVHGDLHGGNILLDSELHCKITDFGLTRHSETTVARSTRTFVPNSAAPELFGMCTKCSLLECDGCDSDVGHRSKTMETDVYAFGCLYYAIFFDTTPFHGKSDFQILWLVRRGTRPNRLQAPRMKDKTWGLIENCWKSNPSKRPTMEQIVEALTSRPSPTPLLVDNSSRDLAAGARPAASQDLAAKSSLRSADGASRDLAAKATSHPTATMTADEISCSSNDASRDLALSTSQRTKTSL